MLSCPLWRLGSSLEKGELAIVFEEDNEHCCLEQEKKRFLFSVLVMDTGKEQCTWKHERLVDSQSSPPALLCGLYKLSTCLIICL